MWPAIMACRKSADKISADIDIAITNYKTLTDLPNSKSS